MTQNSPNPNRRRFLIINLVLLAIFILCLVVVVVTVRILTAPEPMPTAIPTNTALPTATPSPVGAPTLTPTASNTSRPSATPTTTMTPTWTLTPTITPTPTGPPTLPPAIPGFDSGAYELKDFTPEEADRTIALMEYYPNHLAQSMSEQDDATYFQAYSYAVLAQKEALLRFPDAPQADKWRWGLAYDLARLGDPSAGTHYGDLIARGLNQGHVEIGNLYLWFPAMEPRLSLHMIELTPPPGILNSYVIEIRGNGSAFIWLLHTSSAYQAYPMLTGFDYVQPAEAGWIVAELNANPADGDEIAIYFSNLPGEYSLDAPRVFNLGQIPIRELPFIPEQDIYNLDVDFSNYWAVRPNPEGGNDLLFKVEVFPDCPLTIRRSYRWSETHFGFVSAEYSLENVPADTSRCQAAVDHAAKTWGPKAAIPIMETLLPNWPPPTDANGAPYPMDALDEWRYRLGVYHALTGEAQIAKNYLNQIIAAPSNTLSTWIEPSKEFLRLYEQPEDIYKACQEAEYCYPGYAIEYLVENLPPGVDALEYLKTNGISTFASGYFDFEADKIPERWFSLRHRPLEPLELWTLVIYKGGVDALFIDYVGANQPELTHLESDYISEEALHLQPVTFLDSRKAFSMQRIPGDLAPYLVDVPLRKTYPDRFQEGLLAAERALLSGASPEGVKKSLLILADWPGLTCRGTWTCDPYYYLLGLANELAGDERGAIEAYHKLWSDYSRSPYTTMARIKIVGGDKPPTATLPPTSTPSLTPAATSTPGPTSTAGTTTPTNTPQPTVTGTPPTATPTPTITLTPTITATISGTPQVTATATATATFTPTTVAPTATQETPYP